MVKPFRIAIRHEGAMVNAYLASPDTMQDAVLIGAMLATVFDDRRVLFDEWVDYLHRVAAVICENVLGVAPAEILREAAPEHERSGNA
jgi:hypothetical protein